MGIPPAAHPGAVAGDWRHRAALWGRTHGPVPGIDDRVSLRRIFLSAIALWALGAVPFLTIVADTETVTVATVVTYVGLGIVLALGAHIALRTERMPGLVLLGVILWTSGLGGVSEFYYEMAAVTTVALSTAFVAWLGSRLAPLYAIATVGGVFTAGVMQGDPHVIDRTVVVTLAVAFAVTIVGRSSDASRVAHDDREVLLQRLAHDSRHDELTGAGNRKFLIEQTQIALAATDVDTIALALIDIDDFKTVNDTYGHALGDEVLKSLATRIQDAIGAADVVARVGGDEFAVLVTGDGRRTDDIRETLNRACNHELIVEGVTVPVRASIGIVAMDHAEASLKQLLAGADHAMYGRKRASRAERSATTA